ncbi:hypothetical protein [Pirellula sp. SH-Sr6A]|uniref:hypothetical protein n=1 Tax=Pirellula sp. SH-Sr6A TaxID=1632865 RepID=UPI0011BA86BB|nr:hypothetical protein [Pirellula sp. SH-Sr6A]
MRSIAFGWVALFTLALQIGCCGIQVVDRYGNACGTGCDVGCDGLGLRNRIASRLSVNHCNSGCGEVYWDEQINEPPVCDPCGCDNTFIGGDSCGRCPGALSRFRELWGFQYVPNDCSTCSTGHVGASGCSSCQSSYDSGMIVSEGDYAPESVQAIPASPSRSNRPSGSMQPTPAKPRLESVPAPAPSPTPDENARYRSTPSKVQVRNASAPSSRVIRTH